ncbi:hypothetical protein FT663_01264 [Candidozyma haemuli var. vulneris]|nr:hypothetical protein FT662_01299 [[Candida] haemuloni var. vulneris]KAF3994574.1 hypothetical protein FT663_01264 [[Candida] haemuloni var. vulneris]
MAKAVKLPRVSKDHYARTSYLYQAANAHLQNGNPVLARAMARNVDQVAKRTVLKLSPHLKRSICKKCHSLMLPGLTMAIYMENESKKNSPKADVLVLTCNQCSTPKRFPIGKCRDYELFCDKPDVKHG